MTVFSVHHTTTYRYSKPVRPGLHQLMFRPRDSFDQRLLDSRLKVTPEPAEIRWMHDVFGNCVTLVDFAASSSGPSTDDLMWQKPSGAAPPAAAIRSMKGTPLATARTPLSTARNAPSVLSPADRFGAVSGASRSIATGLPSPSTVKCSAGLAGCRHRRSAG
jgi:hypothetical protein